ncbi:MAG: hypothetical protein AAGB18_03610, partial [Pseudomonadota bacterium]
AFAPEPDPEPPADLALETRREADAAVAEKPALDPAEETEDVASAEDDEEDPSDHEPREFPRPELDAAVLGILKAEAEREIAARRAEAAGIENQPELGLAEPDAADDPVGARTRRLRGLDDVEADEREVAVENPARKALLPDVDEINSTLTANSDRSAPIPVEPGIPQELARKRRGGFRLGFALVLLVTAALIAVYLYAPTLGARFPTFEPMLAAYVDWANGMRQSIDGTLENSINALTTFLVDLSG